MIFPPAFFSLRNNHRSIPGSVRPRFILISLFLVMNPIFLTGQEPKKRSIPDIQRWSATVGASELDSFTISEHIIVGLERREERAVAFHAAKKEILWRKTVFSDTKRGSQWTDRTPLVVGSRVFFVQRDKGIRCLSLRDGSRLWKKQLTYPSSIAAYGGMLYVSTKQKLHSFQEKNGKRRWSASLQDRQSYPVATANQLFVLDHQQLVCFDRKTGDLLWKRPIKDANEAPIPIGDVVVTRDKNQLRGRKRNNGSLVWDHTLDIDSSSKGTNVITTGGDLYRVLKTGLFYSVEPRNGLRRRDRYLKKINLSSWRLLSDGQNLYIVGDRHVHHFDPFTGNREWTWSLEETYIEDAVIFDGNCYLSTGGGKIHCFSLPGRAKGDWILPRGNPARTAHPLMK